MCDEEAVGVPLGSLPSGTWVEINGKAVFLAGKPRDEEIRVRDLRTKSGVRTYAPSYSGNVVLGHPGDDGKICLSIKGKGVSPNILCAPIGPARLLDLGLVGSRRRGQKVEICDHPAPGPVAWSGEDLPVGLPGDYFDPGKPLTFLDAFEPWDLDMVNTAGACHRRFFFRHIAGIKGHGDRGLERAWRSCLTAACKGEAWSIDVNTHGGDGLSVTMIDKWGAEESLRHCSEAGIFSFLEKPSETESFLLDVGRGPAIQCTRDVARDWDGMPWVIEYGEGFSLVEDPRVFRELAWAGYVEPAAARDPCHHGAVGLAAVRHPRARITTGSKEDYQTRIKKLLRRTSWGAAARLTVCRDVPGFQTACSTELAGAAATVRALAISTCSVLAGGEPILPAASPSSCGGCDPVYRDICQMVSCGRVVAGQEAPPCCSRVMAALDYWRS